MTDIDRIAEILEGLVQVQAGHDEVIEMLVETVTLLSDKIIDLQTQVTHLQGKNKRAR